MGVDVAELIKRGGVFSDVKASCPEDVYKYISEQIVMPDGVTSSEVYEALCAREKIMSTAVGNAIALPHARTPVIKEGEDQRICVVYLSNPIEMHAPDGVPVKTMFIILTQNSQSHLQVLSTLVGLFQKTQFKKLLDDQVSEAELLKAVTEMA
ncbi:MAG: PTS sugar transporter subunit IIA [Treponema sp.]|nr:PTS sugar transporter subunit IIA [Treponema sp.]